MIRTFVTGRDDIEVLINRKREYGWDKEKSVREILDEVREKGSPALFKYTLKFDGAKISEESFKVSDKEIEKALSRVDKEVIDYLQEAADNIYSYHEKQKRTSWLEKDKEGNLLGQLMTPLERVGIYVPGGRASYPSSVLMNAIPARVAEVKELVMVTPPAVDGSVNSYTLAAAHIAGAREIYKAGGAQAIAALAYGVDRLKPVDKITGPGNIYVTIAKKLVYGIVDIDMLAGPSEILIIADERANPAYIAADMLSQAEHDPLAASLLLVPDWGIAEEVKKELEIQLKKLSRKEIAEKSLLERGTIIITENIEEAVEIANSFAPEHLELMVRDPFAILSEIKNAGAIFMGESSPEPVGDYFAGPNHILPTGGTARFYSPVTVDTFMKKSSIIYYRKKNLLKKGHKIIRLAEIEGLDAHASAIRVRIGKDE